MRVVVLISLVSLITPLAFADGPKPQDLGIVQLSASGNGCQDGTISPYFTATTPGGPADYFEIIFNDFVVTKEPGALPALTKKSCLIDLTINLPSEWQFTPKGIAFEGYADIASGVTGVFGASFQFRDRQERSLGNMRKRGPFAGEISRRVVTPIGALRQSSCGQNVQVRLLGELGLEGTNQQVGSLITTDTVTGAFKQVWHLRWQKCR